MSKAIPLPEFTILLSLPRQKYPSDSFQYADNSLGFREIVNRHFRGKASGAHGVYIVRVISTDEVIYIGKSGTLNQVGVFRGQNLKGRLTNRRGKISSSEWFENLLRKYGPLEIEYREIVARRIKEMM